MKIELQHFQCSFFRGRWVALLAGSDLLSCAVAGTPHRRAKTESADLRFESARPKAPDGHPDPSVCGGRCA